MERRGNGASSPVQYGIWEVEGMGLVLTFRGTCSISSALADLLHQQRPRRPAGVCRHRDRRTQRRQQQMSALDVLAAGNAASGGASLLPGTQRKDACCFSAGLHQLPHILPRMMGKHIGM